MPTVERTDNLSASATAVFEALVTPAFFEGLPAHLSKVSAVELIELEDLGDGQYRRRLRYTAPTDLPRFLKPFEAKAPPQIRWDEVATIDVAAQLLQFRIRPDMPDHWHERYHSQGQLIARPIGKNRCEITQEVAFEIDAPRGFGTFVNRALKAEIEEIFAAQIKRLREYLGLG